MSSLYGNTGNIRKAVTAQRGGGMGNSIPEGYSAGRMQNFTPEMMQQFLSLFSHLGPDSFLSKLAGGDEATFQEMEAPAHREFQGLQGQMASRFSGMGQGARRSSGFQNTMNQASSNFAQDLQSKRTGLRREALQDLFGLSDKVLNQRPYENFLTKDKDFMSQILGGAGDVADLFSKIAPFLMML